MSIQGSKVSTPAPAAQTDEEKKAERLAKLEAWKQKQAAERERKQREIAAAGDGRDILTAMDKKSGLASGTASQSPAAQAQSPTPEATQPAGYAGKFDPKAIAKKANATTSGPTPLGNDVAVPDSVKPASTVEANKPAVADSRTSGKSFLGTFTINTNIGTSTAPLKASGNVGKFGLGSKAAVEAEKSSTKRTLDFGEEESSRKKLEKLPSPPLEDAKNDAVEPKAEEDDSDVDMETGTEEENAAAARVAAEKRLCKL